MHSQRDCAGANGKEGNRMTTAEMLFGSGDLAPSNAAWGRVLGYSQATVDAAKRKEEEPQPPEKKAG